MVSGGCDVAHECFPPTHFCRYAGGAVFLMQKETALNRCSFVVPATLRTVIPDRDLADGWSIYSPPTIH